MSKNVLIVVGILLVIVGIIALVPSWTWETVPTWYAVVKIIVGVIAVGVGATDKKE